MGWVLRCYSPTAPSLGVLVSCAVVRLWLRLPQWASATDHILTSLECWTGVLASTSTKVLGYIPAGLSTASRGAFCTTASSLTHRAASTSLLSVLLGVEHSRASTTAIELFLHLFVARGVSISGMRHGRARRWVPCWTPLWYWLRIPKALVGAAPESVLWKLLLTSARRTALAGLSAIQWRCPAWRRSRMAQCRWSQDVLTFLYVLLRAHCHGRAFQTRWLLK
jgi:hypothetical protein